jgi:hypothetical protein
MMRISQCLFTNQKDVVPSPKGISKNIQTITLILGRFFVHAIASRVPNFDFQSRVNVPALYERRLWPPLHHSMTWPGQRVFSLSEVDQIGEGLERYLAKVKRNWLPLP